MIKAANPSVSVQAGHIMLACRIRPRELRRESSPLAGEVELENIGEEVLEIPVDRSPWQYLNLIITDASGAVVSESFYGDQFGPLAEPYVLRLKPREQFTGPVLLLGNFCADKRQPGTYLVRAVYEWNGHKAVSAPLEVDIPRRSGHESAVSTQTAPN